MKLYGYPPSPNTGRVQLLLEELGVAYELEVIDWTEKQHRSPAYLAINPTGRVPCLVDGDFILWESNAILIYLAALFPEHGFDGRTPADRGEVARWLFLNASHLAPAGEIILAQTLWLPEAERIPRVLERAWSEMKRCLAVIDDALAQRPYLAGSFGLADISIGPALAYAAGVGTAAPGHRHIEAWLDRLRARPAWIRLWGRPPAPDHSTSTSRT
jgi:glutathione S-transferase